MILPGELEYPPLEDVFENTREGWLFLCGMPFARERLFRCPVCGSYKFLYRYWLLHNRQRAKSGRYTRYPYRCDVQRKCIGPCATVFLPQGVVMPREEWDRALELGLKPGQRIERREMIAFLAKHCDLASIEALGCEE